MNDSNPPPPKKQSTRHNNPELLYLYLYIFVILWLLIATTIFETVLYTTLEQDKIVLNFTTLRRKFFRGGKSSFDVFKRDDKRQGNIGNMRSIDWLIDRWLNEQSRSFSWYGGIYLVYTPLGEKNFGKSFYPYSDWLFTIISTTLRSKQAGNNQSRCPIQNSKAHPFLRKKISFVSQCRTNQGSIWSEKNRQKSQPEKSKGPFYFFQSRKKEKRLK